MRVARFDFGSLGVQMLVWYALIATILLTIIVCVAPHFSYSLDDPYIHLALAQNILHGNYGINPGVTVSPSSSVIWPFLLTPFSESPVREWVPLAYNVLFSALTCLVIGKIFSPRLRECGMSGPECALFALPVLITANLVGLTFTGMEHTFQILLVSLCASAVIEAFRGNRVTVPLLAAAAIAPSVRYEDLAFTLAVCSVVFLHGRRKAAVVTLLSSLLPLLALGLYLHAHGLSFFPNSVLAKSGVAVSGGDKASRLAPVLSLLHTAQQNATLYVIPHQPARLGITALAVTLTYLLWKGRRSSRVLYLVPALLASVLMMLLGPYGWFYRYDVAVRLFLFLIVLYLLLQAWPGNRLAVWICALVACSGYVPAIVRTPFSSLQIARQQYQMHRFTSEFAHANVALNDLGWVSFDDDGRFYVLDLVGLASTEALRAPIKDQLWLNAITREHKVDLVMIYPDWFGALPPDWVPLGCLRQRKLRFRGFQANDQVNFYATTSAAAERLRPQLDRFIATLPPGVWFTANMR